MDQIDFIVLFIFLDMCDPLVAFMNLYCMFKITFKLVATFGSL